MNIKKISLYTNFILSILCTILIIIISKTQNNLIEYDFSVYENEIKKKESIIEKIQKENNLLNIRIKDNYELIDSLRKIEPQIKYIKDEKIKFINSADNFQLDSFIRSSWKR